MYLFDSEVQYPFFLHNCSGNIILFWVFDVFWCDLTISLASIWDRFCDALRCWIGEADVFARVVLRVFHSTLYPNEWYRGVMLQPQKIRPNRKAKMNFFTGAISMKPLGSHYGLSQIPAFHFTEIRNSQNLFLEVPISPHYLCKQYHETQKVTNRALTLLRW